MGVPARYLNDGGIRGSSETMRMFLLTVCLVGIQFTWSIEMTYCTPYLLELGLSKSRVSLVWLAGPLSGLIMQPIVGALADRSRSRWGRRRPFMLGGTVAVVLSLILLGWTRQIVSFFVSDPVWNRSVTIVAAVFSIYGIDFAINAVQASSRSLVVDTLPVSKQQKGSAWGGRMVAVGHLMGYVIGAFDLSSVFGSTLGDTQFKQMVAVAAIILIVTVGLTCWGVVEKPLPASSQADALNPMQTIALILSTIRHLPPRIEVICWIQFWCWIGWFPFLFYSSTWLGEIWIRYGAGDTSEHADTLGEIGRVGSLTLVSFSLITFLSTVLLPWLVRSPESDLAFTPRPPAQLKRMAHSFEAWRPDLLTVWAASHMTFAVAMCLAPFVTSLGVATVVVGVCGIPWALQCWAPFTFMGVEINRISREAEKNEPTHWSSRSTLTIADDQSMRGGDLNGVYLGILNIFTTFPQFLGTFLSWLVFTIFEPGASPELAKSPELEAPDSAEGLNGIAVCLFIGGLAAVAAAHTTRKLRWVR